MGSYLALYRKYRPTTFSTVVGQDYIIRTLKNSISKGHISHAYLFTGPRGVGKTTVARIFAKAINCLNRIDSEACENCEVCLETNKGSNPDIIEMNASNQTGVNDMRDLLDKVVFLPTMSKYKVYIIDEVHMLSASSFNALLKTLEEPPKHAIFILCTTEVEKVLPTIRSRCQRYDFHLIDKDVMIERLDFVRKEENIAITKEALSLIADASDGGMRDALSLLDQVSSFSQGDIITKEDVISVSGMLDFDTLLTLANEIKNKNSNEATLKLDELVRSGKEVEKITDNLINFFKDALIIKNTTRKLDKVGYERDDFKSLISEFTNKDLFTYIDILSEANKDYRYSLDKRLYLELALIKMCDTNDSEQLVDSPKILISKNQSTRSEYDPNKVYTFEKKEVKEDPKPQVVEESLNSVESTTKEEVKNETPVIKEESKEDKEESNAFNALFNNVGEDIDEDNNPNVFRNPFDFEAREEAMFTSDMNEEIKEETISLTNDSKGEETKEEFNLFSNFNDSKEVITPTKEIIKEEVKVETPKEEEAKVSTIQEDKEEPKKESHYGIKFIESVLNNADKPFKEKNIILLERAIRESKGSDLHKYALLLEGSTITASSKERMIITFNEVGHCNLVMKEENILGLQEFFKKFMNLYIDFMAIPFDYWKKVSDEFVIKYKANKERNLNNYITLTDIECPGLKIQTGEVKKEKENKFQTIEDLFGDIIS